MPLTKELVAEHGDATNPDLAGRSGELEADEEFEEDLDEELEADEELEEDLDEELEAEEDENQRLRPLPGAPDVVSWITDTGSKGYPLFRFGMGREGG